MEKKKYDNFKTRKYYVLVSKLVYLEARKIAERHKVFWSRISVTEIGDPIDGMVAVEFRGKESHGDLVERDLKYLKDLEEKITHFYYEGQRAVFTSKQDS